MGLVEGYDSMGFEMSKPHLRAALENDLIDICEGRKDHAAVLEHQIQIYRRTFLNTLQQLNKLSEAMGKYLQVCAPLISCVASWNEFRLLRFESALQAPKDRKP